MFYILYMASNNPINILVLFLLSFIMPLAAISNESTIDENMIELGSLLSLRGNTSSWVSSSGHFAFGFYPQGDDYNGYAIGIWLVGGVTESENTLVWTANRDDPPVSAGATLQLTENGFLLVTGEGQKRGLFAVSKLVASAAMLDNGNFVIYGEKKGAMKNVVWQSFEHPTDTILGGQSIPYGTQEPFSATNENKLVSSLSKLNHSSGSFIIVINFHGLVAFPLNSMGLITFAANANTFQSRKVLPEDAYWSNYSAFEPAGPPRYISPPPPPPLSFSKSSKDYEKNEEKLQYQDALDLRYVRLSLNHEGSLCISESQCMTNYTNMKKKPQGTTSSIFRATLEVDGNFRLYEHQFEPNKGNNTSSSVVIVQTLWEALSDECQIKGFCGLNSYCSNVSGKATCTCYPGFVPSQNNSYNNNMFLDCKLNYSRDDCVISDDPIMLYDVTYLENMWWGQFPYLVVQTTKKACEESCKEDCDCGGALYANNNGSCYKYQLPLKYGRRVLNSPFMAILKLPNSSGHVNSNSSMLPPMKKAKAVVVVEDKRSLIMTLAFTFGSISLIFVVFAMFIFFIYKHQVYRYTKLSTSSNVGFIEECSLRSFSFDELEKATSGFTEEIGRGSFGAVYRGMIRENNRRVDIAVKRLEKFVDEGEREFRAEITAIARTHHMNLVKLIGFCVDGCKKLLVYDYVSNGSLANLLFKTRKNKHLPWKERFRIALDVARGVQYLHEECEFRIIHCNIKPQNILMDEAWTAKISDFGFSRLLKHENSGDDNEGIVIRSRYMAPEWQNDEASSSLSVKADVYSFGVVILEIVCRRRSIELNVPSPEEVLLSTWVYQCFEAGELNKLVELFDEDEEEGVEGEGEGEGEDEDVDLMIMERMVKVGLWCVHDDPSMRPSMKNVILMLEGWKDIPIPPSPTPRV